MSPGPAKDFQQVGARIEELLGGLADSADENALYAAEEAVRLLVELYGEGLGRVVGALSETEVGIGVLGELAQDGLVASLLIVHGLHPVSLDDRITAALDSVRPYLGSHAGGVEVIGVDDDSVLQLRLQGSCDGCASSAETVRVAIENAVLQAAPEIVGVHAEGMVERPATLLQIQPFGSRPPGSGESPTPAAAAGSAGWQTLTDPPRLSPGEIVGIEVAGTAVALVRVSDQRYAYRNRCAACSSALDRAGLAGSVLRCPACSSAFDLALAGRPVDGEGDPLEPLPLLADAQGVRIAVPQGVPG